jgi:hypothetical protein
MRSPLAVALALFPFTAFAQDPATPAPEPMTRPEPVAEPDARPDAPPAPPAGLAATEVRDVFDPSGRKVRSLSMTNGTLTSESTWSFDDAGHVLTEAITAAGVTTSETRTYGEDGNVATIVKKVGDDMVREDTFTYADGRPATRVTVEGGRTLTTTWTYDDAGNPLRVETVDGAGALVERTVTERAPAPPPVFLPAGISFGLDAGLNYNSDVRVNDFSTGFEIARKPDPGNYDRDPLELKVAGRYQIGRSKGTKTNDYANLRFGADYNHLFPRTTFFLFGDVERNPVSNLNIDLELAPLGAKLDVIDGSGGTFLDLSFAPVWNYRSIDVAAGGDCFGTTLDAGGNCDFSRVQGSFRGRLGYERGILKISDTVEFLPVLNPQGESVVDAVSSQGVVRNRLALTIKLSERLRLTEQFVFTRDPLLKSQVDCEADPGSLLCDGLSAQTNTLLTFTYTFQPE